MLPFILCLVFSLTHAGSLTGRTDCNSALFATSNVTSSSCLSEDYSSAHASLSSPTAWCPKMNMSRTEYLQADLGSVRLLSRVVVEGEGTVEVNQTARRVTRYMLQVSADGVNFQDIQEISSADVKLRLHTRHVRVVPLAYEVFPCMRLEIYGCQAPPPDTCEENNGDCAQICTQRSKFCVLGRCVNCKFNSYHHFCTKYVKCSCSPGYQLLDDKKSCADINECDRNNGECDHHCKNTNGSYVCSCRKGYSLNSNEHKCDDIDECLSSNGGCNQICVNTWGSYKCGCRMGFKMSADNHTCADIDECKVNNGHCSNGCQNYAGGYLCTCPKGFRLDNSKLNCVDTNECLLANGGCETHCHNTNGSYHCSCHAGYQLYEGHRCKDIDECATGKAKCDPNSTKCRNFQGSYECPCKTGFKYIKEDKYRCQPISCPPLVEAQGTVVSPKSCLVKDGRKVSDTCTFSCLSGYEMVDPSKATVTCLKTGGWSGAVVTCTPVRCPALAPPTNGDVYPPFCKATGNIYSSKCYYSCSNNYKLNGAAFKTCQADGQWDSQKNPTCTKVYVKPWITCPSNVIVILSPNQKEVDISAVLKKPSSNVNNIRISPDKYNNHLVFPAGTTKLTFTATNGAGETASCSVDVIVQDKQAPKVLSCPKNIYLAVATAPTQVTWKTPEFSDNVGVTSVTSNKKSGDSINLGSVSVQYRAEDAAGNYVECSFTVNVIRKKCPEPRQPDNGKATCHSFPTTKWCSIQCNAGFQLFKYTFGSTCDASTLVYNPPIVDCVGSVPLPADGKCPDGKVRQGTVASIQNWIKLCVNCPRGMKYDDVGKQCVDCAVGSISTSESSRQCTRCPLGTYTLAPGSKQCTAQCRPGHYSSNGFDLPASLHGCSLCQKGTYQDAYGQTSCKPCPAGQTTVRKGTHSAIDCGVLPAVGEFGPLSAINVTENSPVELTCKASGTPQPSFKIEKDPPPPVGFGGQRKLEYIRDAHNRPIGLRLTILKVKQYDQGLYYCQVQNIFGTDKKFLRLSVTVNYASK